MKKIMLGTLVGIVLSTPVFAKKCDLVESLYEVRLSTKKAMGHIMTKLAVNTDCANGYLIWTGDYSGEISYYEFQGMTKIETISLDKNTKNRPTITFTSKEGTDTDVIIFHKDKEEIAKKVYDVLMKKGSRIVLDKTAGSYLERGKVIDANGKVINLDSNDLLRFK